MNLGMDDATLMSRVRALRPGGPAGRIGNFCYLGALYPMEMALANRR